MKNKLTKNQILNIAKHLIEEARILNQKPILSLPENPSLKTEVDIPKSLIIEFIDSEDYEKYNMEMKGIKIYEIVRTCLIKQTKEGEDE